MTLKTSGEFCEFEDEPIKEFHYKVFYANDPNDKWGWKDKEYMKIVFNDGSYGEVTRKRKSFLQVENWTKTYDQMRFTTKLFNPKEGKVRKKNALEEKIESDIFEINGLLLNSCQDKCSIGLIIPYFNYVDYYRRDRDRFSVYLSSTPPYSRRRTGY